MVGGGGIFWIVDVLFARPRTALCVPLTGLGAVAAIGSWRPAAVAGKLWRLSIGDHVGGGVCLGSAEATGVGGMRCPTEATVRAERLCREGEGRNHLWVC